MLKQGSRRRAFAALIGTLSLWGSARAADLQQLVMETQRVTTADGIVQLVWWLPHQFWEESMKSNAAIPAAARDQILTTFGDYTMLAMMRATAGLTGITDGVSKDELLKNLSVDVDGKKLEPLPPDQLSPVAQLLLAQLKPAMASMVGQLGENLEFVVFPAKVDGKPLLDAAKAGNFTVKLYDQTATWRLPLGSLLPKRSDRKTGEQFPGNYNFNPYTGDKLAAP
ncbi:MAG: hypothetical protein ABW278_03760 [Steroidobacteraceae bacterium]